MIQFSVNLILMCLSFQKLYSEHLNKSYRELIKYINKHTKIQADVVMCVFVSRGPLSS